ncbi:MAG: hypothetical protein JM58_03425 [Peptococcaceae bacterium BICA1-8]|nr:MAG: hypothetical protein JM58_03425 [Peptococcaceae bacterium BICA1-8]
MNMQDLPVIVTTQRLVGHRLDVVYPVVSGNINYWILQKINSDILNMVYFLLRKQGYYENPLTTVTGTYELKNNQRGILSLSIINYAFAGGAHGMTYIKSLTFDVVTGRTYRLSDLFIRGSDYIGRLSEIIRRQIVERDLPLINEFQSINPEQDYYIADKALVIYFQLYDLTPYVYGFPYFPISVYEIQDIIDENGPLGKMLY